MNADEAWVYLDTLTRGMPESKTQSFGHRQLVDVTGQLGAAELASLEDALLVLLDRGDEDQKGFAIGFWGAVRPSARALPFLVDAYLAAPRVDLGNVLGQHLFLPYVDADLDRLVAHFLADPAASSVLAPSLMGRRGADPKLWAALTSLIAVSNTVPELFDILGAAMMGGREDEFIPLLAAQKPVELLKRLAPTLDRKERSALAAAAGFAVD